MKKNIITELIIVLAIVVVSLFIGYTIGNKAYAEEVIIEEQSTCDSRCEVIESILYDYIEGYDGNTAPILEEYHNPQWWGEFNDIINYLADLREEGVI